MEDRIFKTEYGLLSIKRIIRMKSDEGVFYTGTCYLDGFQDDAMKVDFIEEDLTKRVSLIAEEIYMRNIIRKNYLHVLRGLALFGSKENLTVRHSYKKEKVIDVNRKIWEVKK